MGNRGWMRVWYLFGGVIGIAMVMIFLLLMSRNDEWKQIRDIEAFERGNMYSLKILQHPNAFCRHVAYKGYAVDFEAFDGGYILELDNGIAKTIYLGEGTVTVQELSKKIYPQEILDHLGR